MMRLQIGQTAPDFNVLDSQGNPHSLSLYAGQPLMVSFYRFAACPLCNFRVNQLIKGYPSLARRHLKMLAFFHSPASRIRQYVGRLNPSFPLIADPEREVYARYGTEQGNLASPSSILAIPIAIQAATLGIETNIPDSQIEGGRNQIPADFLILPDGTIHTAHYGQHISDHISMGLVERFLAELAIA